MPGLPLSVSGQDPAKEMDLGGSLTVFDLEVHHTLDVTLVRLVASRALVCGRCACETEWQKWHMVLKRNRCLQMEEVVGPRPQTAHLQKHLRFIQSKLAPLVNANEIAELRV